MSGEFTGEKTRGKRGKSGWVSEELRGFLSECLPLKEKDRVKAFLM